MAKAQGPNLNNDLDPSQNKAINLAGQIATSANIMGIKEPWNFNGLKNQL
jgi:hypothetical protein